MAKEKYVTQHHTGKTLWLFNWNGGGFNDVFAFTKKEAIAEARKSSNTLVPDEKSFRKATPKTAAEQDKLGWMMTC